MLDLVLRWTEVVGSNGNPSSRVGGRTSSVSISSCEGTLEGRARQEGSLAVCCCEQFGQRRGEAAQHPGTGFRFPPFGQAWLGQRCSVRGWVREQIGQRESGAGYLTAMWPNCQHLRHCENLFAEEAFLTFLMREKRRTDVLKRATSSARMVTRTEVADLPCREAELGLRKRAEMMLAPTEWKMVG